MSKELTPLYTEKAIRHLEKQIMHIEGIDEWTLMNKAGLQSWLFIQKNYPNQKEIAIFCGGGNNGGDGYLCAYYAQLSGCYVVIHQISTPDMLNPLAKRAHDLALSLGIAMVPYDEALSDDATLIVDAMIGIGLKSELKPHYKELINYINMLDIPVLALDIPSGLHADTGTTTDIAIKADKTLTFIGLKSGLYTGEAKDYTGEIYLGPLYSGEIELPSSNRQLITMDWLTNTLPKSRYHLSHKGDYGHVLIIGGNQGMLGATILAAMSAYRVGCGVVTIACHPSYEGLTSARIPEALCFGINHPQDLTPLIHKADVVIIGPGLGQDDWAKHIWQSVIQHDTPMVVDADALRLLAQKPCYHSNWILTPHIGEASNLLQSTTKEVHQDRFKAIDDLQKTYGGVIVLKGSGTLIKETNTVVCPWGNPYMATAGMGDILSGIIGGTLAKGHEALIASMLGVTLHAEAGDRCHIANPNRGMMASDIIEYILTFQSVIKKHVKTFNA